MEKWHIGVSNLRDEFSKYRIGNFKCGLGEVRPYRKNEAK